MGNFIYCVPEYHHTKGSPPKWCTVFDYPLPVGKSSYLEWAMFGKNSRYDHGVLIPITLNKEHGYAPNSILSVEKQLTTGKLANDPVVRVGWCSERDYVKALKSLDKSLDLLIKYTHSLYSLQHTELRLTLGILP